MNTATIREKFLVFFQQHGHAIKDSVPLIPEDDPTLLFISAGMAAFKPYFLGLKTDMKRAASCQKCFRTTDIENVGYTARHHTFFEMLGNFSFGDYFKKDAIAWAWEFITKELGLDKSLLYISVHHTDDEALEIWNHDIGVPKDHIIKLGDKDNFWTIGIGPSGPCSEIYIDQGPAIGCGKPDCAPGCDCPRFLEFWNLVFTQYDRAEDGKLTPLEKKNIDTGMGLERLAAILQGKTDNFENDLFSGIITKAEEITGHRFSESPQHKTALKVVADHIRALSVAIADGALPGNEGRGYVLRKILRRASRFGCRYLGQEKPFLSELVPVVAQAMSIYPNIGQNQEQIAMVIRGEEERFLQTLRFGTEMLSECLAQLKKACKKVLDGSKAFLLHDTYGFPLDLTREICREEGFKVDEKGFSTELEKQRERGRANVVAAFVNFKAFNPSDFPATRFVGYESLKCEGKILKVLEAGNDTMVISDRSPFYAASGGQVGDVGRIWKGTAVFEVQSTEKVDEVFVHVGRWTGRETFSAGDLVSLEVETRTRRSTMRNHTATHLLQKALRELLGTHVKQAGSFVAPDRLRFDFTHFQPITPESLAAIETRVNERVFDNLPVTVTETTYDAAVKTGAMALFGEKYGDRVRLVKIGDYSSELCGGTHLSSSAEVGIFRITAESSISAGVRRIEAITGESVFHRLQALENEEHQLAKMLVCEPRSLKQRIEKLLEELSENRKDLAALRRNDVMGRLDNLRSLAKQIGDVHAIIARTDGLSVDEVKQLADDLLANAKNSLALLATSDEKANFVLKITKDLIPRGLNAGSIIREVAKIAGGGGGGRPEMATAGGKDIGKIDEALAAGEKLIRSNLKE